MPFLFIAPQEGLEPPTPGSEDLRSNPLSYWGEISEPSKYLSNYIKFLSIIELP